MMWAIGVKFLRGVCVATDTGQWDEAEWPPHPARLFMALAATSFETQQPAELSADDRLNRQSLQWLERQHAPDVFASEAAIRTPVTVFVPVNDSTKTDQLLPSARSRQPRFFPTSIPHHDELYYVWDGEIQDNQIAESLERIAFDVSRLGHSSSLVQVWIEREFGEKCETLTQRGLNHWTPAEHTPEDAGMAQLRVVSPGSLQSYEESYNLSAIEDYVAMQQAVRESKGKEKRQLKSELEDRFPEGMPPSHRPPPALSIGYQCKGDSVLPSARSHFDRDMMVLEISDAPTLGLESTLQLAGAVRKKIHDAYGDRKSPEWLGGHRPDGSPTQQPHIAIVPLPFVDHPHADGHLMGLAIVFPREVSKRDRAVSIRSIFDRSEDSDDWVVKLRLNDFRQLTSPSDPHCDIQLVREQRLSPARTLSTTTWTQPCSVWETVTPIVLDRFPKTDRHKDQQAWNEEVAEIIARSCENVGLPKPGAIHVHHNAFVSGVPKSRPTGGGFPTMPSRSGKASRFQIHARIEFDIPVIGPVILGAGRFVGYGFCRPNLRRCKNRRRL